ncbi:hypothetical protein ACNH6C_14710 [Bdellovibrio bacteriovorus]|uniref:hypothetical protein n=1 Tax=Bdellovibrio bacteriovorus TaxID=959 RepID=UPI003A7F9657
MNKAEQRIQYHKQARQFMLDGNFEQALSTFRKALSECGPHVGLLCDFAGCFYEMGRFQECWEVVAKLKTEFAEAQELLSQDSKIRTLLMLGKFHEEMAESALALNYYRLAGDSSDSLDDKQWIYVNELRVLAYFAKADSLQQKYLIVTEMKEVSPSLQTELLHGLMWSEWALFGYGHGVRRFQAALNSELNDMDKRLLARDFLEISILSNQTADTDIQAAIDLLQAGELLDYDQALLSLFTGKPETNQDNLSLTTMMKIRLLILQIKSSRSEVESFELKKKYNYLVKGLSQASQSLFQRIEPQVEIRTKIQAILHPKTRQIHFLSSEPIVLTKMQAKLLGLFSSNDELDLDLISQEVWQTTSDEGTYDRLRMMIYKLNKTFHNILGFHAFEVHKNGASIHAHLKIQLNIP